MKKEGDKLGVAMTISVIVLILLMCLKNEIGFLSREDRIFTEFADGVFFSIGDFLTYNVFVICAVLTILWIYSNISERLSKQADKTKA
ncbi:hypothetical protein [Chryseobacterium vrystaatense]|uniref:Uncharacterized protein n=1 Tax=Chryseobacterium vrystaatense TaxID=307480 RepID=A0A1M4ZNL4_9FLAO|nr:hypothetical protein [Chryseobacterium vrystaatense]SHF19392.1 hypothetical protein SAMN02787073_1648 [Chryseobacterium vrystaatense]